LYFCNSATNDSFVTIGSSLTILSQLPFTRCDLVPLVYSLSNDLFVMEQEEKPGGDLAQGFNNKHSIFDKYNYPIN